ncbi:sensor histidine kinase [Solibacillus cecembensis]|uniref:sensor histidine kinase n=1 Tax=Solibacillus cecembensis TaxID=459347 RepID=UPI003D0257BA
MNALPKAQAGIMDLTTWDFDKGGPLPLNGEWNYYEGELLSLDEIQTLEAELMIVPSTLNGKGKGTYHLQIQLPEAQSIYGLKINNIRMSHALFMDNEFIGGSGQEPFSNRYVANNTPYISFFHTDHATINLIVQVENRDFVDRGIIKPIYFGTQQTMMSYQSIQFGSSLGLIMILSLFSLYHLIVFAFRKKNRFFLYSGAYFFILAITLAVNGERVMLQIFPEIPFVMGFKIRDFFGFLTVIPFLLFINTLDYNPVSRKAFRIINLPIVLFLLLNITLPFSIYTKFQALMWVYVWVLLCYILIRMTVFILKKQGIQTEKDESILIYFAFICLTLYVAMNIFTLIKPVQLFHEIWMMPFIIIIFIFMARRTTNVMELLEQSRSEGMLTKISYLNLQIKPHFINNAISNIISLCYTDNRKAAYLLGKLSTYLRLIFENNQQEATITFQKELELIKAYVEIEKTRFNDRIHVHFAIDENIQHVNIPSLSIQPFVENAIRHGLFNKLSQGNLFLSAKAIHDHLEVIIEDDGIGMSAQLLSELLSDQQRKGIGIQNVHSRLKMIPGASLEIRSIEGKGTTVIIQLPI